jgi:hypothetical protein
MSTRRWRRNPFESACFRLVGQTSPVGLLGVREFVGSGAVRDSSATGFESFCFGNGFSGTDVLIIDLYVTGVLRSRAAGGYRLWLL